MDVDRANMNFCSTVTTTTKHKYGILAQNSNFGHLYELDFLELSNRKKEQLF